ncbi:UDP-glycosyltransferase 13-like [Mangifera indica]|uniref:UDP-glycosyltransferase 13-like n=1 Tax=Mangifera indica TaxID=29780 RepID=UPI001CFB00DC|nr:UDP-glycosyltransferase 13-like [Mangifera indica]XP_044493957.1 UDP-glycosyltransferase 13-like [Mangifera indica]
MSTSDELNSYPHVAILPSSGMGHLMPFLRLAATLVQRHCRVTLITINPTASVPESQVISRLFSTYPQITEKQFHLLPFDPTSAISVDPLYLQWEAIRSSSHLLAPILSSMSPSLSALVLDVTLTSSVLPVTTSLGIPNYVFFTSSARMYYFCESFPTYVASRSSSGSVQFDSFIEIPGLSPIPISSIPPALKNLNHLFSTTFIQNGQNLAKSNGIIINSFEALEDILHEVNGKRAGDGLQPIYSIGPLLPCQFEKTEYSGAVKWLDEQLEGSVVYVCFGSRSALSSEQIKELGDGLVRSGNRFLWVVKAKKVDEDEESLDNLLGHELTERIKNHGLVTTEWVNQQEILNHKGIGGIVTHGGWNSLMEAVWHGLPMLVWPQTGDQKINAEVIERSGLGMWVRSWGWGWGAEQVVKGQDFGEKIKELMENNQLRQQARNIGEEARKAVGVGGSSERMLKELIEDWKKNISRI